MPGHGARVRLLMGTYVNASFFQVPTPEFGHGARVRVQGLDFVFGHFVVLGYFGLVCLNTTLFFCRCSGSSARALSVNMALEMT